MSCCMSSKEESMSTLVMSTSPKTPMVTSESTRKTRAHPLAEARGAASRPGGADSKRGQPSFFYSGAS